MNCNLCETLALVHNNNCKGCLLRHAARSLRQTRQEYMKDLKQRGGDIEAAKQEMIRIRDYDNEKYGIQT